MILARQKHLRMILASNFPLWDFFWGNTCSECPFFSVILLFCYSVILLFCYSVILLFCCTAILLYSHIYLYHSSRFSLPKIDGFWFFSLDRVFLLHMYHSLDIPSTQRSKIGSFDTGTPRSIRSMIPRCICKDIISSPDTVPPPPAPPSATSPPPPIPPSTTPPLQHSPPPAPPSSRRGSAPLPPPPPVRSIPAPTRSPPAPPYIPCAPQSSAIPHSTRRWLPARRARSGGGGAGYRLCRYRPRC